MATTVVFDLLDTLNDRLTTALAGTANVIDGTGNTADTGNFIMIGVDDPDVEGFTESVEAQQEWVGVGASRVRYEEGTVSCCAMSWNGDGSLRAARAAVKVIIAAVENHLRSDPNLGGTVAGLNWAEFGKRHATKQGENDAGAGVIHFFQIDFKARI